MRLLDESGKQIGILTKSDALKMAQAENKDLVEISGNAKPAVVKLIDFKKFKYLEAKKERESKKTVKHVGIKEIRLSPFMGEHDFHTRVLQGQEFLAGGNQLKISVPFRGREITHKEFGYGIINKAINFYQNAAKTVKAPYFEGRILVTILSPVKSISKENVKNQNEKSTSEKI